MDAVMSIALFLDLSKILEMNDILWIKIDRKNEWTEARKRFIQNGELRE